MENIPEPNPIPSTEVYRVIESLEVDSSVSFSLLSTSDVLRSKEKLNEFLTALEKSNDDNSFLVFDIDIKFEYGKMIKEKEKEGIVNFRVTKQRVTRPAS